MSLEKLISEIAASHPVATRAQRVTGVTHRVGEAKQTAERAEQSAASAKERVGAVEETLEGAGVIGDDGVPPGYPTVTAEAFFHQVDLYWSDPPASDAVAGSLVRIRPENEASRIVSRPSHSATIKNLPHKPHTFEVLLFDKWGRESRWSDPVSATPMLTAAEEIDLGEIAMLGRLRGLLPDTNLATITDATKLADELVSSGKIAPGAVTGPKLPDGVINGPKLAASAVEADKIAANAVTAPKILSDQIQTRHITAGAVTASVMAAQDAAAFNLWAQNAMIRNAAIQSISADKITAGQMTAGRITLAGGGALKAGEVTLNASGVTLPGLSYPGDALFDTQYQQYTISESSGKAKLYFKRPYDAGSAFAGFLQGESGNQARGMAFLAGIDQPQDWDHNANAMVRVGSYRPSDQAPSFIETYGAYANHAGRWYNVVQATEGFAELKAIGNDAVVTSHTHDVDLLANNGVINCGAPLRPDYVGNAGSIAPGSWLQWTHGFGRKPDLAMAWNNGAGGAGDWRPMPGPAGTVYINWCDAQAIRVANDGSSRQTVGVVCY